MCSSNTMETKWLSSSSVVTRNVKRKNFRLISPLLFTWHDVLLFYCLEKTRKRKDKKQKLHAELESLIKKSAISLLNLSPLAQLKEFAIYTLYPMAGNCQQYFQLIHVQTRCEKQVLFLISLYFMNVLKSPIRMHKTLIIHIISLKWIHLVSKMVWSYYCILWTKNFNINEKREL